MNTTEYDYSWEELHHCGLHGPTCELPCSPSYEAPKRTDVPSNRTTGGNTTPNPFLSIIRSYAQKEHEEKKRIGWFNSPAEEAHDQKRINLL